MKTRLKTPASGCTDREAQPASVLLATGGTIALQKLMARVARLERQLAQKEEELDAVLAQMKTRLEHLERTQATPANGNSLSRPTSDYPELIFRLRQKVERSVPAGSTVLVISKGDEELLRFGGRKGWHFPQLGTGIYAGCYPADSRGAIQHLDELRGRGAEFLVVPATATWWLQHYAEFGLYLRGNFTCAVDDAQTCVVFDLRSKVAPSDVTNESCEAIAYASLLQQLQELVNVLLPSDAKLAVASRGDPRLLEFQSRKAWHFPLDASGRYAGHHPADDREALEQLSAAKARGAQFLLIPATGLWWLDHYRELNNYLRSQASLVFEQPNLGIIFEI